MDNINYRDINLYRNHDINFFVKPLNLHMRLAEQTTTKVIYPNRTVSFAGL